MYRYLINVFACLSAVLFYVTTPQAGTLDSQEKALGIIADFSEKICNNIPLEGSAQNHELSGEAKAELVGLIKKITDIGIEGAGKYQSSEYQGVLQNDLSDLIRENSACKYEVFKDLKDRLLVEVEATNTKNLSEDTGITDGVGSPGSDIIERNSKFSRRLGEVVFLTKENEVMFSTRRSSYPRKYPVVGIVEGKAKGMALGVPRNIEKTECNISLVSLEKEKSIYNFYLRCGS